MDLTWTPFSAFVSAEGFGIMIRHLVDLDIVFVNVKYSKYLNSVPIVR
jgi:hypothetical protein